MVVVTHLKAKLPEEHVRFEEGNILLHYLHKYRQSVDHQLPIIICGDLNTDMSLYTYPLFKNAKSTSQDNPTITYTSKLSLDDAYCSWDKTPRWSTYKKRTEEQIRTIDYIFFTPAALKLIGLLEIPELSSFKDRLPAFNFPSDHVRIRLRPLTKAAVAPGWILFHRRCHNSQIVNLALQQRHTVFFGSTGNVDKRPQDQK